MEVLNHQNLIRLYEVMETGTKIYLISEWAPAGDLYSKVTLRGKLPGMYIFTFKESVIHTKANANSYQRL